MYSGAEGSSHCCTEWISIPWSSFHLWDCASCPSENLGLKRDRSISRDSDSKRNMGTKHALLWCFWNGNQFLIAGFLCWDPWYVSVLVIFSGSWWTILKGRVCRKNVHKWWYTLLSSRISIILCERVTYVIPAVPFRDQALGVEFHLSAYQHVMSRRQFLMVFR